MGWFPATEMVPGNLVSVCDEQEQFNDIGTWFVMQFSKRYLPSVSNSVIKNWKMSIDDEGATVTSDGFSPWEQRDLASML